MERGWTREREEGKGRGKGKRMAVDRREWKWVEEGKGREKGERVEVVEEGKGSAMYIDE